MWKKVLWMRFQEGPEGQRIFNHPSIFCECENDKSGMAILQVRF